MVMIGRCGCDFQDMEFIFKHSGCENKGGVESGKDFCLSLVYLQTSDRSEKTTVTTTIMMMVMTLFIYLL